MVTPILQQAIAYYREDDPSVSNHIPPAIKVCNISSVAFYVVQGVYALFLLYKFAVHNERSVSLIVATVMILYSSITLAVFFAWTREEMWVDNSQWSPEIKVYYVFCNELPFTCIFISHWIIM